VERIRRSSHDLLVAAVVALGRRHARVPSHALHRADVNLTMSGLVMLGTVAHYAWTHKTPEEQVEIYKHVAALDWSQTNPLWQETGFVKKIEKEGTDPKYDVTRSRTEIDATAARIMDICEVR